VLERNICNDIYGGNMCKNLRRRSWRQCLIKCLRFQMWETHMDTDSFIWKPFNLWGKTIPRAPKSSFTIIKWGYYKLFYRENWRISSFMIHMYLWILQQNLEHKSKKLNQSHQRWWPHIEGAKVADLVFTTLWARPESWFSFFIQPFLFFFSLAFLL
jgi:hypothetical protein